MIGRSVQLHSGRFFLLLGELSLISVSILCTHITALSCAKSGNGMLQLDMHPLLWIKSKLDCLMLQNNYVINFNLSSK